MTTPTQAQIEAALDYAIGANFILAQENEELRKKLAATIERCAQVVEQWERDNYPGNFQTLIARIRKLKDEP